MNQIKKIDVLGLGSVTVDFVGTTETWPNEGLKQPLKNLSIHDGGLVGTALAAVAKLDGSACFAGKLGNSDMARRAVESLEKECVDTSFIIRTKDAEPIISLIISNVFSGQRNVFWTKQNVQYPYPSEFPDKDWFNNIKVLFVDFSAGYAGVEAAKIATKYNIPVIVDIEHNEPHVLELMAVSSHIVLSENFAADYTGETDIQTMLKKLKTSSNQTVIITRGKNGCIGLTSEGLFELSAFKVDVVDTTGCGDVFHGVYALAIARNKTVVEAAQFASAAAALCATKIGGRDGIPTKQQLDNFVKARPLL